MTFDKLFDGSDAHLRQHIVPVNDLREHITDGNPCWCHPIYDEELNIAIHHSMDLREQFEEGRKLT
jgi:hypothetical protein